jgi:hypothetical protein
MGGIKWEAPSGWQRKGAKGPYGRDRKEPCDGRERGHGGGKGMGPWEREGKGAMRMGRERGHGGRKGKVP